MYVLPLFMVKETVQFQLLYRAQLKIIQLTSRQLQFLSKSEGETLLLIWLETTYKSITIKKI